MRWSYDELMALDWDTYTELIEWLNDESTKAAAFAPGDD
jgi:hypothetical protein